MGALPEPKQLGWIAYFRYVILRFVLWLTRNLRSSRFAASIDFLSEDPFVYGGIPHPREFEEEWPYPEQRLKAKKIDDRLTVFCTSPSGQMLIVKFTRGSERNASVFVYLRTQKAAYVSVNGIRTDLSSEDTFAVDGLKLECVIPMRRWRISFNGPLRNQDTGKDDHVRFVFTANFTNNLADLWAFQSERLLALTLCKSTTLDLVSMILNPGSINEHLKEIDSLVQTYSFVGKVRTTENSPQAESYDEEVYAFGQKTRSHEKDSSAVESRGCFMGYTRNGISCYFEDVSIANFAPSLTSAVIHYPSFVHTTFDSIHENVMDGDKIKDYFELQSAHLPVMKVKLQEVIGTSSFIDKFNSDYRIRQIQIFKMSFDDREGFAVFIGALGPRTTPELPKVAKHLRSKSSQSTSHVVSFEDETCSNGSLTGGKASSLAVLTNLALESEKFKVPRGVAVTTVAYSEFTKQEAVSEAIENLRNAVVNQVEVDEMQRICANTVEILGQQSLPQQIKDELEQHLRNIFGNIDGIRFAVRSSACGEDSEEMSAAGQMETLLGVKSLPNIFDAVAKCWASQFSFVAVQYRRRYGQPIDCPMAVCVQEMVDSEVSGVMFTVDPVTANPAYITITANYGLGESVVAATADPDTFVLEKTPSGGRVISSIIGSKKLRTVMLDEGGTRDITDVQEGSSESCLTENRLSQLAEAAVAVEKHYASQRDTEWAFAAGGQLFMLQARPVTSAHVLDTEFESYHEADEGVVCEYDCLSKANVGEVFGGSVSPLTLDTTFRSFLRMFKAMAVKMHGLKAAEAHFSRDQFFFRQNAQCFFGTYTIMTDYSRDDVISKGFSISMCGRIIDDEVVMVGAENKKRYALRAMRPNLFHLIRDVWNAEKSLDDAETFVRSTEYSLDDCKTSKQMLIRILSSTDIQEKAIEGHSKQIFYGTINNVLALSLLSHTEGGYTPSVYGDFARMVASCNNLVSADVPLSLQKLSLQALEDYGLSFKDLPVEEALLKLKEDSTATAGMFAKFLKDHGHRCLNEFDLVTRPWVMDPTPVVKTIQSMIGATELMHRADPSADELIDSLQIKMNLPKRLALRFLLHRVRKGVANRERAKSNLILASHKYRLLFRQLADQMVREGLLPDPDLMFFLVPSEIYQLMETRSPKIIIRAMNRMRIKEKAAKDIYPEHVSGLPVKPINWAPVSPEVKGSRQMRGTPVSQGTVVATARVVMSIEDAHQIQKGDVLITYATDIGWSPYFPLLGGIVTELGGLISHGAVVAREYGLPCIVAAHGATQMFRSGEKVLLDGTKGVLQTVE